MQDLIFEKQNYSDTIKRMKSILSNSKDHIGGAMYNTYFMLTSSNNIEKEILQLKEELKSFNAAEQKDANTLEQIQKKTAQLNALQSWRKSHSKIKDLVGTPEFTQALANSSDESKKAFQSVLEAYDSKDNQEEPLTYEGIDDAFSGIVDYIRLQNDNEVAVRNISFLASPEGFEQNFNARNQSASKFYKDELQRRSKVIGTRNLISEIISGTDQDIDNKRRQNIDAILTMFGKPYSEFTEEELKQYEEAVAYINEIANKHRDFAADPEVIDLKKQLDQAMADREFDETEGIMQKLEELFGKYMYVEEEVVEEEETPEEPENKKHTVRKNADGTFSVISPEGNVVGEPFDDIDEATDIAEALDEALKNAPSSDIEAKKAELEKANDEVIRLANLRANDKVVRHEEQT